MELRLMAHFSQDRSLCKLFNDNKKDPFKSLASIWLNLEPGKVYNTYKSI